MNDEVSPDQRQAAVARLRASYSEIAPGAPVRLSKRWPHPAGLERAHLVESWDDCAAEVGLHTAWLWGLHIAACRVGFERNEVQLVQVLGANVGPDGADGFPLRPTG